MLLTLLGTGQGTAATGINVADVIERLLPALGTYQAANLIHWDAEELYEYADQGVQALARATGLFVERDATTTIVNGTALYTLPTRHLSTIHVSVVGQANLRGASVADLEALSDTWLTDTAGIAAIEAFTPDFDGTEKIRLYKSPTAGGTLAVVFHQYPTEIAAGTPTLTAPTVLEDYVWWEMLRAARAKESDAAMPEVAEHAEQVVELYTEVIRSYWGEAV